MDRRLFLMGIVGGGLVAACSTGRSDDKGVAMVPPSVEEQRATIAGLRPPKRRRPLVAIVADNRGRSEEHTAELRSLMRISYAVYSLQKKKEETGINSEM